MMWIAGPARVTGCKLGRYCLAHDNAARFFSERNACSVRTGTMTFVDGGVVFGRQVDGVEGVFERHRAAMQCTRARLLLVLKYVRGMIIYRLRQSAFRQRSRLPQPMRNICKVLGHSSVRL